MYNVFIIDDNYYTRKSLISTIDWTQLDCHIVGEAENGKDALEKMKNHAVDIIITDIQMPGMDGLTFITKCQEIYPHIKFIIITGYNKFDYAKRALQLEVVDIILKPINNEDLMKSIINTQRKIKILQSYNKTLEENRNSKLIIERDYLKSLLLGHTQVIHDKIQKKYKNYVLLSIKNLESDNTPSLQSEELQYLLSLLNSRNVKYITLSIQHELLLLLYYITQYDSIMNLINNKLNQRNLFNIYSFSDRQIHLDQLAKVYKATQLHFDQYFYRQEKHTFMNNKLESPSSINTSIKDINSAITSINFDTFSKAELINLVDQLKEKNIPVQDSKQLCKKLIFKLYKQKNINNYMISLENINTSKTFKELSNLIFTIYDNTKQKKDTNESSTTYTYERIIDYIKDNFSNKITLNKIADYMELNPSYISRLIHNMSGKTFTELLKELRMKESSRLLLSTNYKVYEVADSVGIHNYAYFYQQFKNYYGISPKDYRNSNY